MASESEIKHNMFKINKKEDVLNKIKELISLTSIEDKNIAESIHELALAWDMKILISYTSNADNTKTTYWITYSAKKPFVRSIFMFIISTINDEPNATFGVRHKFTKINPYIESLERFQNSTRFEKLTSDEWDLLRSLIIEEYNSHTRV